MLPDQLYQLRVACRPGRAWAPRLARYGRFGQAWPPRTARSKSLERPKLSDKAARESPTGHFRRFGVDFGSVLCVFHSFLTCHGAGDSTRCAQGQTFVFACRRSTLEGSQAGQKTQNRENSIEHCLDDASRASRVPEAHRFPSRVRLSLDCRRLGALPDAPRRVL